ncbi:hypothetical protein GCM10009795_020430 [Nocardioides hankookensis]|uniref:Uncharacterized protein n=1 Tax=Nocardioides hankookensis TaxID=443157 RepID=A0ABW1LLR1_9ACTN
MYLGLCLIGVIAAVWAITALPTRPHTETVRPRDLERRDAQLRACPDRVTKLDVERALAAHPLPEATIARVLGTAAERGITARTMWVWVDRFGADKLVLAIDADVAERRLRRHLDAGTAPDWAAMMVFADLNNETGPGAMPIAEFLDLDAVPHADELQFDLAEWETPETPVIADVDLSQFSHLPPIYNPGLPVTRTAAPPVDQAPRTEGGWPQVA